MAGTKKKQVKTRKNTKSHSKKRKLSSKTQTSKLSTTAATAKKKTDSKPSVSRKKIDACLSSSVSTKKKQEELSLHDVLQNLKKKSISNRESGGHGFIRPTEEEKTVLKNSKVKNAMGRPKKSEQDRKNVVSIRFSLAEQQLLILSAEKNGYSNWKDYLRELALSHARNSKSHA